jgi:hypothetical protein
MRLLDTLIKKRDFHRAQANKFSDLIALLESDEDLVKLGHQGKLAAMNGAKAQFDALQGEAPEKKKTKLQSPEFRKAASRRMKLLWKKKRNVMLRGARLGSRNRQKNRAAPATT